MWSGGRLHVIKGGHLCFDYEAKKMGYSCRNVAEQTFFLETHICNTQMMMMFIFTLHS